MATQVEAELKRRNSAGSLVAHTLVTDEESASGYADPVMDKGVRDTLTDLLAASESASSAEQALLGDAIETLEELLAVSDFPDADALAKLEQVRVLLASTAGALTSPLDVVLQVGGTDVSGGNPVPIAGTFADENGVPFSSVNPLPVDIGGSITVENLTVAFDSVVSTLNKPSAPLDADEEYIGTWEDVGDYAALSVIYLTDAWSAIQGAKAQFSEDGTNVLYEEAGTVPPGVAGVSTFFPRARYFRVHYTNGAVAQTVLRSEVRLLFTAPGVSQSAIGSPTTDFSVGEVGKAALVGHDAATYTWNPITSDPGTGALLVDTGLTIPTPQTDALTNDEMRATPVPVSGTVTIANPTANPETGLAKDATLTALLPAALDADGGLKVHVQSAIPVTDNGGSLTVDGSVTASVSNFPADQKVHDDYQGGEVLADQTGAGAVLTFTFSSPVNLVLVHTYSAVTTDLARVDPFGGTPSASTGIRALNDVPTFVPVTATVVKVFAPAAMEVSVSGFRRA